LNYLFHLFLSGPAEEALIGSLLGDFVKGSPAGRFSPDAANAILFHRKIDSFSDAHPIHRRSRKRVSPEPTAFCANWRRQLQARGAGRKPGALSQPCVSPSPPA
jgi:acyl carrier protein phosphodiesterase